MVLSESGDYKLKYVFSSNSSQQEGNLIIMNIDLGPQRNGIQVLRALDNQRPSDIAKQFAKEHHLGPKTQL